MSNCEQLRPDYDAYALGVLEGAEREAIAEHLERGCPACTQGVAESRTLVAQLALAAPAVTPSPSVRSGLLAEIAEHRRRHALIPAWAWLAAAALLLFSLYTTWQTRELARSLREQAAELAKQQQVAAGLAQQREQLEQMQAILTASDTRAVPLKPNAAHAAFPDFRAFWNPQKGLVLAASNVPSPAEARTYQLWVVPKKGNPVSAGVFRPENGQVLMIAAAVVRIADAAALAISEEPGGGSPQPTSTPLWIGPVR